MGPSATPSSGLAKPGDAPQVPASDIVSSIPAPIVRLLVILGRPIAWLRIAIEVLAWKAGRRVESWMVVGAWWGICLGAGHAFKYLLPVALFLPLLPLDRLRLPQVSQNTKNPPPPESTAAQPSTQDTLLHTLSNLHTIYALIPPSPVRQIEELYERFAGLGHTRLTRGFVIIWSTWLALGWIVGYRALLALLGSIILLFPSPAFAQLLHLLSKSLAVRRSIALLFLLTFGSPPDQGINFDLSFSVSSWVRGKWAASRRPSLALAFRPKAEMSSHEGSAIVDEEAEQAGEPIYFRFEVHENQRWWMGLDWTSALLPQERPSWCDSHLLPASPPPSFPLPPSSSITLPAPTTTDPKATVKRTATWKWLDDDWSIVRAGPGQTSSPPMPAPSTVPGPSSAPASEGYALSQSPTRSISAHSTAHHPAEDHTLSATARAHSIAEQAFTKGLERFKARTTAPATTGSPRSSVEISRDRSTSQASEDIQGVADGVPGHAAGVMPTGETICERDDATDADGWVYGDNKWESTGPKGGLGRFTRRRRWQRRAICTETIERIPSVPSSTPTIDKSPAAIPSVTPLEARPILSTESETATARRNSSLSPTRDRRPSSSTSVDRGSTGEREGMLIPGSPGVGRDDVLRQRLKKAMGSVGG